MYVLLFLSGHALLRPDSIWRVSEAVVSIRFSCSRNVCASLSVGSRYAKTRQYRDFEMLSGLSVARPDSLLADYDQHIQKKISLSKLSEESV